MIYSTNVATVTTDEETTHKSGQMQEDKSNEIPHEANSIHFIDTVSDTRVKHSFPPTQC
jgi:hypothetical protein